MVINQLLLGQKYRVTSLVGIKAITTIIPIVAELIPSHDDISYTVRFERESLANKRQVDGTVEVLISDLMKENGDKVEKVVSND